MRRVTEQGALLIAEAEHDGIVGTVIAGFDGWRGGMYRLAVVPEHRRRGVARALVRTAEDILAARGCRRISVLVVTSDDQATAFWSSVGCERGERMARYVKTLDPGRVGIRNSYR